MERPPSTIACTATWRFLLAAERRRHGDVSPFDAVAPDEGVLDLTFVNDWAGSDSPAFLAWTFERVYFPVDYDGAVCVRSVPRHPLANPEGLVAGGAPSSGGEDQ